MMLQWTVPAVKGNKSVSDGSMAATIEALHEQLQPEAAYYMANRPSGCSSLGSTYPTTEILRYDTA
jgi:hypothetical protein